MVEYHGWFAINESVGGEHEGNILSIIKEIEYLIAEMDSDNRILILKPMNGRYFLHVAGTTNHRCEDVEEVFKLIHLISKKAKGSYGILYLRDDEDKNGKENEFVVYVMARGQITEKVDNMLSPCNPVIEQ